MKQSPLPLPPPILCSEENSFARYTIANRLPAILKKIIKNNHFSPRINENLERLQGEIFTGKIRGIASDGGADLEDWENYIQPFKNKSWFDVPFYFIEAYFYRRILEATEYFQNGEAIDPFTISKQEGLRSHLDSIRNILQSSQKLTGLFHGVLWGNRADLSLWKVGGSDRDSFDFDPQQDNILVDDTTKILERLAKMQRERIDFIIDNAGFELTCDLLLCDRLLQEEIAETIVLHLKADPIFVSDATIADVNYTIHIFAEDEFEEMRSLSARLQNYLASGALVLQSDRFWNSPLAFWEMSDRLTKELEKASLVFIKGDANYRRLLGDRHWDCTDSFSQITHYFPASFVALRTLKSEIVVGLQSAKIDRLDRQNPQWKIDGSRGVIQFVEINRNST
ncbi:MAG: protein-glutamate O-methyltransferase family protein [Cyanobacteria bacterium SBLK]|nr:protein-glutamate O-methyltransferase family protein [Cyanobacteria bacterium SBLK]